MSGPSIGISESDRERAQEVDRLISSGAGSIPRLLELLDEPSWVVRRAVVAGLAALGEDAVGPLVEVLISGREDEARIAAAVDALVGSVARVEPVITARMVTHGEPAVIADAAQILGRRRDPGSAEILARLLEHPDDNVAVAATEALGRVGGRAAVDALVAAVGSGHFFRVFPAIDVLGRSGDPRAIPALGALLPNPMYAAEAARALGRTGERAAVGPLAQLLSSPSDTLVRVSAVSLADLHRRHAERYGEGESVAQALRAAVAGPMSGRRLAQALAAADAEEQAAISLLLGVVGGAEAAGLLTQLLSASEPVSQMAAAALRRLGHDAEGTTREILMHGDSARRRTLLPIVLRSSAVPAVIECLSDPDPAVRALASEALARIGNPAAVGPLFGLLPDPNPAVVQAALGAIQALGGKETEALALEASRSEKASVRRSAYRILSYFGYASALPAFLEGLRDPDERVRDAVLQGLPFLEDRRGLEALLEATRDERPRMRASAMRALGFATGDLRIQATLLRGLKDGDDWVRYYACQALGRLGVSEAVGAIAPLLKDPAGQVRVAAVEALSNLESPLAGQLLAEAASSDEEDIRRAALIGLGMARHVQALDVLLEAARSPDHATRLVAISAIADFSDPEVTRALARGAMDADESVRSSAISYLANRPGQEATLILLGLLPDPERRAQVRAALSLYTEGRVHALLTTLESANDEVAPELTSALARMRRPDATAALFHALDNGSPAARRAAATALAAIGTPKAMEAVRDHAAHDPDPEVRRVCALLLTA